MGFNENLKGELEYKGMLVKELAHESGIPKKTLDKYMLSNGSMPPADKAVIIAQILDVSVEYLVSGKENKIAKTSHKYSSPELRSITECVEPLSREKRKIIEASVIELTKILNRPSKNETITFTPLQKAFLRLFR